MAGLTLLNSFTWSHAIDNASSTLEANTPAPQNGYNLDADFGQSDYNLPIANVTSLVYDLPVGKGRLLLTNSRGPVNAVLGGWQISAINTMQAGTPFNLTYSPNSANAVSPMLTQSWRGQNLYRPNLVSGVPYTQGKKKSLTSGVPNGYLICQQRSYIAAPPPTPAAPLWRARSAVCPRTTAARLPSTRQILDFNKKFNTPIERMKVEFRSEFYNLFNHTNLYLPGGSGGGSAWHRDRHHIGRFDGRIRCRRPHHPNLGTAHHPVRLEGHLLRPAVLPLQRPAQPKQPARLPRGLFFLCPSPLSSVPRGEYIPEVGAFAQAESIFTVGIEQLCGLEGYGL